MYVDNQYHTGTIHLILVTIKVIIYHGRYYSCSIHFFKKIKFRFTKKNLIILKTFFQFVSKNLFNYLVILPSFIFFVFKILEKTTVYFFIYIYMNLNIGECYETVTPNRIISNCTYFSSSFSELQSSYQSIWIKSGQVQYIYEPFSFYFLSLTHSSSIQVIICLSVFCIDNQFVYCNKLSTKAVALQNTFFVTLVSFVCW